MAKHTYFKRYPTWINCTLIVNYNKIKIQFQGHCFIVFDPKAFTDDFEDRMSELIDYCRQLESVGIPCNVVNFAFTATELIQTNNVFGKKRNMELLDYRGRRCFFKKLFPL